MSALAEQGFTAIVSACTAAGIVAGIFHTRKTARLAELKDEREQVEAARREAATTLAAAAEAAANLKLREQEAKAEDRSATAQLIENLTSGYDQLAQTLGAHIASLENRVRDLESIVHDRDNAVRERDNVIRRLREQLHLANNELFKAGLQDFIRQPKEIVGDLAPDRRTEPPPAPELTSE